MSDITKINHSVSDLIQHPKVVLDNSLARTYWPFALEEQKALCIIFYAIQHLDKKNNICVFDEEKSVATISVKGFFDILGITGGSKVENWRSVIGGMKLKTIVVGHVEKREFVTDIVRDAEWLKGAKTFTVQINKAFLPYIRRLKVNYSLVNLDHVLKMNSRFSVILFRNLSSLENIKPKTTTIPLAKLKKILGITDTQHMKNGYFNIWDFEQKTLCVAKKEINNLTDLDVNFSRINGGKDTEYKFTFDSKSNKTQINSLGLENKNNLYQKIKEESFEHLVNSEIKTDNNVFDLNEYKTFWTSLLNVNNEDNHNKFKKLFSKHSPINFYTQLTQRDCYPEGLEAWINDCSQNKKISFEILNAMISFVQIWIQKTSINYLIKFSKTIYDENLLNIDSFLERIKKLIDFDIKHGNNKLHIRSSTLDDLEQNEKPRKYTRSSSLYD